MLSFDIFCEVIDNFGDIGVVYRFANELLKRYNSQNKEVKIRVFLDKTCELTALDNKATEIERQILNGIEFITFNYLEKNKNEINPSEVIVEAFGYNLPSWYLEKAKSSSSLLINLEYLSSEEWTLDFHLRESLIGAPKLKKFFFMPGLSPELGGVIIPSSISNVSNKDKENKEFPLLEYSNFLTENFLNNKRIGSIFTYEYNFNTLLDSLNTQREETILLFLGEKSQLSIKELLKTKYDFSFDTTSEYLGKFDKVHILFLPFMVQSKYDSLLSLCDFNLVRGEDSFVRGVLSSKPFLWHAYLQDDLIHLDKIDGFLNVFNNFVNSELSNFKNIVHNYSELMIKFNTRVSNSFTEEKPLNEKEDFTLFFSDLDVLTTVNKEFSQYIITNCDLITKFTDFIKSKLGY